MNENEYEKPEDSDQDQGQEEESNCYDLEQEEIPITMKDKKKGITKHFIIREPKGDVREKMLNKLNSRARSSGTGVKDFVGIHAEIITLAMFDDQGTPVNSKEVNSWPGRVQDDIFRKVLKIAGLDKKAEDEAKND